MERISLGVQSFDDEVLRTLGRSHSADGARAAVAAALDAVGRVSIDLIYGTPGETPEEATANLNAMNALFPDAPWELSFSYGRALQEPALKAWQGEPANAGPTQQALLHRARLNAAARSGSSGGPSRPKPSADTDANSSASSRYSRE